MAEERLQDWVVLGLLQEWEDPGEDLRMPLLAKYEI